VHVVIFTSDDQTYAIPTGSVVEVIPAVEWRPLPHVEAWVKGVINYRATLIPLLDFALLLKQDPRALRRSARIVIVRTGREDQSQLPERSEERAAEETTAPASPPSEKAQLSQVGLLVEQLLGSENLDLGDHTSAVTGISEAADFLGPVALTRFGTIQLIDVAGLPIPDHL
jgi:chemotaxis signal transduction protein